MSAGRVVWVLSDGKAGHFNQSRGVLRALEQLGPIQVHWVEVKLRTGLWRPLFKFWQNRHQGRLPLAWLHWAYRGLGACPAARPDLIVATGGKLLHALIALGRHYGAKTVFVGTLHGLQPALLDAVVVLETHPEPQYVTVPLAPMAVDEASLQQAAQDWQQAHPEVRGRLWAMLIGGDGAGAQYHAADWQRLAAWMNDTAARQGIRWLLTTSRRTGPAAEQLLQQHLQPQALADAVWWGSHPRPVMAAFLGRAELVCCGVDSLSMITEAVTAQRPVLLVQPVQFAPEARYAEALQRLQQRGWVYPANALAQAVGALARGGRAEPVHAQLASALQARLGWV